MFLLKGTHYCVFIFAVAQALISTLISLFFALILAYFFDRFSFKLKSLFVAITPLLCIMPSKLTALGVQLGMQTTGIWAIIFGHCALNIPFAFYIFYNAYQNYNSHWRLIAKEYGASHWQAYKHIDIVFLYPAIISAASIIFLLCFTSFSLPLALGTQDWHMTPDIVVSMLYKQSNYDNALYYFILRLVVILPICWAIKKKTVGWFNVHAKPYERFCFRSHSVIWPVILLCISIIILGPLLSVLLYTVDSKVLLFLYHVATGASDLFLHMSLYTVLYNSIILALISSIGAVILGYVFSKALMYYKQILLRGIFLLCTSAVFILGSVGCGIVFSMIGNCTFLSKFMIACACHMMLNYPFAYRLIQAHLTSWQSEWDLSAQSFGASSSDRWRTLELPYLKNAMLQAFCIAFGLSLTEVGAGSMLNDSAGMTIPMAIKIYRENGFLQGVIGLNIILLCLVLALTWIMTKIITVDQYRL